MVDSEQRAEKMISTVGRTAQLSTQKTVYAGSQAGSGVGV